MVKTWQSRPVDNRSLFLKRQQKELTLFTAGHTLFVIYSSPLRQKTLKLSCCGAVLEPLLCMSCITLIHSDHWLLRTSLGELPSGRYPQLAACQRGRGRKTRPRSCFIWSRGRLGNLATSMVLCLWWCFKIKINMYSETWQIWSCNSFTDHRFIMKCPSDCLTKARTLANVPFTDSDSLRKCHIVWFPPKFFHCFSRREMKIGKTNIVSELHSTHIHIFFLLLKPFKEALV